MTTAPRPLPVVLAVVAGAVLAGTAVFVLRNDGAKQPASTVSEATAISTTSPVQPGFRVHPTESPLGAAVIVPVDLNLQGRDLELRFEMHDLSPIADHPGLTTRRMGPGADFEFTAEELTPLAAGQWTLLSGTESMPGVPSILQADAVRFRVPEGFTVADIDSVRTDSVRLPVPFDVTVDLIVEGGGVEVMPDLSVAVDTVLAQPSGSLVLIDVMSPRDGFEFNDISIDGVGAEWGLATREPGRSDKWFLAYFGALPDTVTVAVQGVLWAEVGRDVTLDLSVVTR